MRIHKSNNTFTIILTIQYLFVAWLMARSIQKLVLVVKGVESKETLERWVFDVECTSDPNNGQQ